MAHRRIALVGWIALISLLIAACSAGSWSVDPKVWRTNTIRLVNQSDRAGGYAEASSGVAGEPSPYATFYTIRTYRTLDSAIPADHGDRTVAWVKSLVEDGGVRSGAQSGDEMGEIFYVLSILGDLNAHIANKKEISRAVHQLQFESGPYAFSQKHRQSLTTPPDSAESLLATYEALQILSLLGEEPRRQETLTHWVQEQWDQMVAHGEGQPTTTPLSMLAACLQMLSPADQRLHDAWKVIRSSLDEELTQPDRFRDFLLMDVAAAVEAAERFSVPPDWVPQQFLHELQQRRNGDGGFSAFLNGDSDHLGTYLAAKVLRYAGHDSGHQQSILELLGLHQGSSGGYYTVSSRPISLTATRGVAQASRYLQITLDKDSMVRYLTGVLREAATPGDIHLALDTARLTGLDLTVLPVPVDQLVAWAGVPTGLNSLEDLERLYHATAALNLLRVELPAAAREQIGTSIQALRNQDGGYGPDGKSNLQTTARVATILSWTGMEPQDRESLVLWIQKRQKGGFSEPGAPTDLGTTYLALQALDALNAQPADIEGVRRWIATCFRQEGGARFAPRTGDNAGVLMWTGLAIRALELAGVEPVTDEALSTLQR